LQQQFFTQLFVAIMQGDQMSLWKKSRKMLPNTHIFVKINA
jgi:hypothetical protein